MKKYFYLVLTIVILFLVIAYLLHFNILAYKIAKNLINIRPANLLKIQIFGVVIYLLLGISFSFGGYYCAKKKE